MKGKKAKANVKIDEFLNRGKYSINLYVFIYSF